MWLDVCIVICEVSKLFNGEGEKNKACMCGGERAQTLSWKDGFESKAVTSGWWLVVGMGLFSLFHLPWMPKGQTKLFSKCGV